MEGQVGRRTLFDNQIFLLLKVTNPGGGVL